MPFIDYTHTFSRYAQGDTLLAQPRNGESAGSAETAVAFSAGTVLPVTGRLPVTWQTGTYLFSKKSN